MIYFYSATKNAFYQKDDFIFYEAAGSLPDDLIEVDYTMVAEFSQFTNGDLIRVAGKDGFPTWGDRPPMTSESGTITKNALMNAANAAIDPLQDASDLDMATDEEKSQLTAWKKYRVLLSRVDTSNPAGIEWPQLPVVHGDNTNNS